MSISSAEQAADRAEQFLGRYYPFRRLTKSVPQNGVWVVEFDIGPIQSTVSRLLSLILREALPQRT